MKEEKTTAPRVFLSHASEDKEDYAEPLAIALCERGVDAWLDKWEIRPGDSLVDRLFEEGIKGAAAIVVIVSKFSVNKPWVKKELDVSVVRSIGTVSRLIPVTIDDAELPESLRDLVRIEWHKKGSADAVAQEIANVVFDVTSKPPLGPQPKYLSSVKFDLPGLTKQDTVVLELVFLAALETVRDHLQAYHVKQLSDERGIEYSDVLESIEVLIDQGVLWDKGSNLHIGTFMVEIPPYRFLEIAQALGHDIEGYTKRIASLIINDGVVRLIDIADRCGCEKVIAEGILSDFESRGFIGTTHFMGNGGWNIEVRSPSAQFKRWLNNS